MIKFLCSLLLIGVSFMVQAQTRLEFSRVVLLENSVGTTTCNTCWTVPAGKVWKVESVGCNSNDLIPVMVNGRNMGNLTSNSFATGSSSYWGLNYGGPKFPFWLPAGATLGYNGIGSSQVITFFVLEFTVL